MDSLEGKAAVVTGAASGIGLAMARRFAAAGMDVVMADIEAPVLDEAGAQVDGAGPGRVLTRIVDVTDAAAVDELARSSIDELGRINVVCNNAGVAGSLVSPPDGIDLEAWRWVIEVNLWGVVHGHRAFLPHLVGHGDGHIVNTASMAGHLPGHSAYMASKWAVVGITEGLFAQLRDANSTVGVSCLCPGWVRTRIVQSERNRPEWAAPPALDEESPEAEAFREFVAAQVEGGREPDEVADLVHDAIVDRRFWIFTDDTMVQGLGARFDAILDHRNPPRLG